MQNLTGPGMMSDPAVQCHRSCELSAAVAMSQQGWRVLCRTLLSVCTICWLTDVTWCAQGGSVMYCDCHSATLPNACASVAACS